MSRVLVVSGVSVVAGVRIARWRRGRMSGMGTTVAGFIVVLLRTRLVGTTMLSRTVVLMVTVIPVIVGHGAGRVRDDQ